MTRSRLRSAPYSGESCSRLMTPWAMLWSCRSSASDVLSSSSRTVHLRPVKNCFRARTWRRNRSGLWASSRISESESKTTRVGLVRSTSARTARVVMLSSTSEGWNIVYWLSGSSSSSGATSSKMSIPSSDQPCDFAAGVELVLGLGEGDVEAPLALVPPLHQELQGQGRLARARLPSTR